MEKVVLAVILIVALGVLARIVWRSVRTPGDRAHGAQCNGCPFVAECDASGRRDAHETPAGGEDGS